MDGSVVSSVAGDLAGALARAEGGRHRRRAIRPWLHHLTRPAQVTATIFTGQRMRVVLPEIVGTALYRHGFIEAPLTRVMLERLRPGMIFVDVGAHYGYHSLVASLLVGPTGAVVALEPGRQVRPLLRSNTAGAANVSVHALAAGRGPGRLELSDFGAAHSALTTALPEARVPPAERRRLRPTTYGVDCAALDDHLGAAGLRPDFVKLDAEGAELDILAGMERILTEAGPLVSLEVGDYEGMAAPGSAECLDVLEGHGYRAYEYGPGGLTPHTRRYRYGYDNLFFLKG